MSKKNIRDENWKSRRRSSQQRQKQWNILFCKMRWDYQQDSREDDENIFDDRRGLAGSQKKMEGSGALKLLDKETWRKKLKKKRRISKMY